MNLLQLIPFRWANLCLHSHWATSMMVTDVGEKGPIRRFRHQHSLHRYHQYRNSVTNIYVARRLILTTVQLIPYNLRYKSSQLIAFPYNKLYALQPSSLQYLQL